MPKARIDNLTRYAINPATGCWHWTGPFLWNGYGKTSRTIHGTRLAHRVLYIEYIGPVPDGLELDHMCRNRACVNPWHMEPVTSAENTRRGWQARLGGRCLSGAHDLAAPGAVMVWSDGRRRCLACYRQRRSSQARTELQAA